MKQIFTDLLHFNRHVRRPLKRIGLLMAMCMLMAVGVLGALSADVDLDRKEGGLQSYPVVASETIYKGAMVGVDADGYLNAMSTTLALRFVGIAYEKKDNSSGLDAAISCRVYTQGVFKLTATAITQAMVGMPMFCTDDATMDNTGTNEQLIGKLVEYVSATSGWVDIGQRDIPKGVGDHLYLLTDTDTKNVRIQSRDYTATSGDSTAGQTKPQAAATGTLGLTGWEFSPRFADGVAGSKLVGVMSNPILKGTTGDLSSAMRCYEAKLESDSGSTRTVAEAYILHAMQAMHGTVTAGPDVIKVDAAGGNVAWRYFFNIPDDGVMAHDTDTGAANTITGYIQGVVGTAVRYIYLYTLKPSG